MGCAWLANSVLFCVVWWACIFEENFEDRPCIYWNIVAKFFQDVFFIYNICCIFLFVHAGHLQLIPATFFPFIISGIETCLTDEGTLSFGNQYLGHPSGQAANEYSVYRLSYFYLAAHILRIQSAHREHQIERE